MFTDQEFEDACRELDHADVDDWEFFTESHGVKIYRQYNEQSGLYSYKVYGSLDVSPETCSQVYMDYEYRKTWDSYVHDLYPIDEGDKQGLYWRVKYPFPMSHRDYCYIREMRELDVDGKHVWVILSRSEKFEKVPEKSGVIRVDDYLQSLAITHDDQLPDGQGCKAYLRYYDNPKGMIPTWLINWAAKSGVPGFLDQMQEACKEYQRYKAT